MNMRLNAKQQLALILLLVYLLVLLGASRCSTAKKQSVERNITVTVTHSDGTKNEFAYSTNEIFLGTYLAGEGLITEEVSVKGLFNRTVTVTEVDGERADATGKQWKFRCNGLTPDRIADYFEMTDGDAYEFYLTDAK